MEFIKELPPGKKVYFASDFHLGAPTHEASRLREQRLILWLERIKNDAYAIFLLGDLFDFWFEYKHAIPKGFARFNGKLAEINDSGIPVHVFTGNHDLWMFDYFPKELGIPVYYEPQELKVNGMNLLIGHGDGLGPGDKKYKALKKIFTSRISQWLFARLHPNVGIALAQRWSRNSRINNGFHEEESFGDQEHLFQFCKTEELKNHHDYYIFGHRHIPMEMKVNETSKYINLGEWVNYNTYAVLVDQSVELEHFRS